MTKLSTTKNLLTKMPTSWALELRKIASLRVYLKGQKHLMIPCVIMVPVIAAVQFSLPLLLEAAVNQGIVAKNTPDLIFYSLMFLAATVLSYVVKAAQSLMSILIIQRLILRLRGHLISHILKLKPAFHDSAASGFLLTRATNDFDSISDSLNHGVLNSIVELSGLLGRVVALLFLDLELALISFITLPLASYSIARISKIIRGEMHKTRRKTARLNSFAQETLYQNPVIKLFGAQKQSQERFHRYNKDFQRSQLKVVMYDALLYSFIEGLSSITIGLTLWLLAGEYLGLTSINPGVVVAFVQVLTQLFDPLKQLGATITMLQAFFTSLDRILILLSLKHFIGGNKPFPQNYSSKEYIRFHKVSFRYQEIELPSHTPSPVPPSSSPTSVSPWILKEVSFSLRKGSTCALVGATGSGKSTIAKLLVKLYDGYQGSITVKGAELSTLDPEGLGDHIAMVRQDLTLFAGTVDFNISLGREGISREDVIRAAKSSGAHRFISEWPDGYDQKILESGLNLSHGEKQLLSLSRALCKDPEIIILDEATSAMDPVTEADLKKVMSYLSAHKTVMIIAHKLTTIQHCEKIIVLSKGEVVEMGSHEELSQQRGVYHGLVQSRKNLESS